MEVPKLTKNTNSKKIVFVYNADSGYINAIMDYATKALSPNNYQCKLCGLTYGLGGMKSEWKNFIAKLGLPSEFLHHDEFIKKFKFTNLKLPSVFIKDGDELRLIISQDNFNEIQSLEELMTIVRKKVDQELKN